MKYLALLLLLSSCASTEKSCKLTATEDFYGTRLDEYSCNGYYKYCRIDAESERKINCFTTQRIR